MRNYRGRHDLFYLESSSFLNLAFFYFSLSNIPYMTSFLDRLPLPLPQSDYIPIYRVSLKISCPELTILKMCWQNITVQNSCEVAHFLSGWWVYTLYPLEDHCFINSPFLMAALYLSAFGPAEAWELLLIFIILCY